MHYIDETVLVGSFGADWPVYDCCDDVFRSENVDISEVPMILCRYKGIFLVITNKKKIGTKKFRRYKRFVKYQMSI